MKSAALLLSIALSTTAPAHGALAAGFDVVIVNGRVMDPETGVDQVAGAGVSHGWITADPIARDQTAAAAEHVVAPGFIDLEPHGLGPWAIKVNLRATAEDGIDGWSVTRSDLDQMNRITAILDEGQREGALGVGPTIGYARAGITTHEMHEARTIAGKYGRLTSAHHRFHPSASTPAETQTGVNAPLHIHHDNDCGWWENQEKMKLARDQGCNVWASHCPWTAGSGNHGASILGPDNWEGAMGFKYEDTIFDPQLDRHVAKDEFLELAETEPGRTVIAFGPPREEWLPDWIKLPKFTVSGDGMPGLNGAGERMNRDAPYEDFAAHPRAAGAHAAVLRLGRENDIPLVFNLAQLSYWHAMRLGATGVTAMDVRGRRQEGMVADITIFDPATVTENATCTKGKNGLPSSGIPYVLVNGAIVVAHSKVLKDVHAGQPIRFPVEDKGRFAPSSKQQWLSTFTIDTGAARPTLIDDITDDGAQQKLPDSPPRTQDVADAGAWLANGAALRFSAELDTHFHGDGHRH